MQTSPMEVTRLLQSWSGGDQAALERLLPIVYDELRRLAKHYMYGEQPGHTLQATALVHEAYLRMADHSDKTWDSRAHFFAVAAQAMRHILVDHARARGAAKRGSGIRNVSLEEAAEVRSEALMDLVALDGALTRLAGIDPRMARIVELRFFGGLSVEDAAHVLGVSTATVVNETRAARAWLHAELEESSP